MYFTVQVRVKDAFFLHTYINGLNINGRIFGHILSLSKQYAVNIKQKAT